MSYVPSSAKTVEVPLAKPASGGSQGSVVGADLLDAQEAKSGPVTSVSTTTGGGLELQARASLEVMAAGSSPPSLLTVSSHGFSQSVFYCPHLPPGFFQGALRRLDEAKQALQLCYQQYPDFVTLEQKSRAVEAEKNRKSPSLSSWI